MDASTKYIATSAAEMVEIVDESNNVLAPKTRAEMRKDKLIHRATYAFVRDSNNYFYVQKRSSLKDYCPNFFDPTPGGVVAAGESYEDTNRREIEEEMGIKDVPMKHLFNFFYEDSRVRCFGDAWDVVYDGPLKLQSEEVDSVHMMSMHEILTKAENGENFTPDSIFACRQYVEKALDKEIFTPKGPRPTAFVVISDTVSPAPDDESVFRVPINHSACRWPQALGSSGEDAKALIVRDRPELNVSIVKAGSMVNKSAF